MRCVGESWERGVMRGNVIFVDFRGWSVRVLISAREMKELCLVMFQSEASPREKVEQDAVR